MNVASKFQSVEIKIWWDFKFYRWKLKNWTSRRNPNRDLYWQDLKSYRQRSQFWCEVCLKKEGRNWRENQWPIIIIIIINPLTARVVGAPQMILQPVFSIFPCSPLPSGTLRTPGLSIPWCCLPTASSVCRVFFPLSLCLARWFWPSLMNGKHDRTTAVCVSLLIEKGVFVWCNCLLDLGADFLVGNMVFDEMCSILR